MDRSVSPLQLPVLPDDCLLLIFDHLPLRVLLTSVARVSRHWAELVPVACRARNELIVVVRSRRASMADYIEKADYVVGRIAGYWTAHDNCSDSPTAVWISAPDCLRVDLGSLVIEKVHELILLLPNIRRLTVCHFGPMTDLVEGLILFLLSWRCQLVSFTLWRYGVKHPTLTGPAIARLFAALNRMPKLRRLTLDTDDRLFGKSAKVPPLTILSQLEEFYLFCLDKAAQSVKMLQQQQEEDNTSLKRIRVRCEIDDDLTLMEFLRLPPSFARKFQNLLVYPSPDAAWLHLDRLVALFSGLTSVWFSCNGPLTVQTLVHALQPLKHLTQVGLRVYQGGLHLEKKPRDVIPALPAIRGLELTIYADTHIWTPPIPWAEMFPNLRAIRYFNYMHACDACAQKLLPTASPDVRKTCVLAFLKQFAPCRLLRMVQSTFMEKYTFERVDLM